MRRAERQIRELLGPLDPMPTDTSRSATDPPDVDTEIPAIPSQRPCRGTRWPVVAAAAAAITALVAGALVWSGTGPATPPAQATPAPLTINSPAESQDTSGVLNTLAERAAESNMPYMESGQTEYIKMKNWYLDSQIEADDTTSAVQPARQQLWREPDGSGRTVTTELAPTFPDGNDRSGWDSDAAGDKRSEKWNDDLAVYGADRPPTDTGKLRDWLARGHGGSDTPEQVKLVESVTDLVGERALLPQERASMLRLLANLDALHYDGTTHDRAGRSGYAFSLRSEYTGLPTRYTLIIAPDTGKVLGYEEMLTDTAGKLNVAIPAVTEYETYLRGEFR